MPDMTKRDELYQQLMAKLAERQAPVQPDPQLENIQQQEKDNTMAVNMIDSINQVAQGALGRKGESKDFDAARSMAKQDLQNYLLQKKAQQEAQAKADAVKKNEVSNLTDLLGLEDNRLAGLADNEYKRKRLSLDLKRLNEPKVNSGGYYTIEMDLDGDGKNEIVRLNKFDPTYKEVVGDGRVNTKQSFAPKTIYNQQTGRDEVYYWDPQINQYVSTGQIPGKTQVVSNPYTNEKVVVRPNIPETISQANAKPQDFSGGTYGYKDLTPKQKDRWEEIEKLAASDPQVKAIRDKQMTFDNIEGLLNLAENGDSGALGAAINQLARSVGGEKGVMTDRDFMRASGVPIEFWASGIDSVLKQVGSLDETKQISTLKKMLGVAQKIEGQQYNQLVEGYAKKAKDQGLPSEGLLPPAVSGNTTMPKTEADIDNMTTEQLEEYINGGN